MYGSHEPITVEAARILAQKSGVGFTSFSHTAAPMAVFAEGVGASEFGGMYDNTELYEKLIEVIYLKIKGEHIKNFLKCLPILNII